MILHSNVLSKKPEAIESSVKTFMFCKSKYGAHGRKSLRVSSQNSAYPENILGLASPTIILVWPIRHKDFANYNGA